MILRTGFSISLYLLLTILFSKNFSFSQGASCGAGITALTIGNCTTFTNNDDTPLLGTGQPRNCGSGSAHSDVWYRVVGNGQQLQIVFTSNRNPNVSVYNTCPNTLAYASGSGEAQCTAANANTQSTFNLNTTNETSRF